MRPKQSCRCSGPMSVRWKSSAGDMRPPFPGKQFASPAANGDPRSSFVILITKEDRGSPFAAGDANCFPGKGGRISPAELFQRTLMGPEHLHDCLGLMLVQLHV